MNFSCPGTPGATYKYKFYGHKLVWRRERWKWFFSSSPYELPHVDLMALPTVKILPFSISKALLVRFISTSTQADLGTDGEKPSNLPLVFNFRRCGGNSHPFFWRGKMKWMYQPRQPYLPKLFQEILADFGWHRTNHQNQNLKTMCSCLVSSPKHCDSSWKLPRYKCVANFHQKNMDLALGTKSREGKGEGEKFPPNLFGLEVRWGGENFLGEEGKGRYHPKKLEGTQIWPKWT